MLPHVFNIQMNVIWYWREVSLLHLPLQSCFMISLMFNIPLNECIPRAYISRRWNSCAFSTLACSLVRDPGGPASFPHAVAYNPDNGISFQRPPGFCTEPAFLRTGLHTGTLPRPHRSVPTDPVLGLLSRCGWCWACLSTQSLVMTQIYQPKMHFPDRIL